MKIHRIYHTWDKWECYPARFYEIKPPDGMLVQEAENKYKELLSDIALFSDVLAEVIVKWKNSCEHYLTNERMNRIAWLGQASLSYEYHIPARFCGGYNLLTDIQKKNADLTALKYLNIWMNRRGYDTLTLKNVVSKTIANLY